MFDTYSTGYNAAATFPPPRRDRPLIDVLFPSRYSRSAAHRIGAIISEPSIYGDTALN
jgi:hypothetical protein